jgi:hypothetical protein
LKSALACHPTQLAYRSSHALLLEGANFVISCLSTQKKQQKILFAKKPKPKKNGDYSLYIK